MFEGIVGEYHILEKRQSSSNACNDQIKGFEQSDMFSLFKYIENIN